MSDSGDSACRVRESPLPALSRYPIYRVISNTVARKVVKPLRCSQLPREDFGKAALPCPLLSAA